MANGIPPEVAEDRVFRPRLTGIHIAYIQDVCDTCLQYRFVRRNEIYHRLHGKIVMCKDCQEDPKNTGFKKKDIVSAIREEQWDRKEFYIKKRKKKR